jgi:hypothetical protein
MDRNILNKGKSQCPYPLSSNPQVVFEKLNVDQNLWGKIIIPCIKNMGLI